jgi:nitrate/TMAO reductase-like tetraheme cytochrome c subunit
MAGRWRAFWKHWWGKLSVVVVILLVLAVIVMAVASQYTESNKFCGTACHEMDPYNATWLASKHSNVNCVTCHIGPGLGNFLVAKVSALREVWVHITGQVKVPIAVTSQVPNGICQASGCHLSSTLQNTLTLYPLTNTTFSHSKAHAQQKCIACHDRVVHPGVPGHAYIPPQSMAACFKCHTDGTKNCGYCHAVPKSASHPTSTACTDCHNLWSFVGGKNFAHPQPLVGTHAAILCEQCHLNPPGPGSPPTGCVNCHGDQHNGLKDCATCHVLAHFTPANFNHPQEGPHVPKGDEPLQCNQCHLNGFGQPASCPCHGGKPPTGGG